MQQWENLPVFIKAREIMELVGSIIDSVEKTDIEFKDPVDAEMIEHKLKYLSLNASIIPAKIAGASSEDMLYDLKMEHAALIRKAARDLITDARGLQMHGYPDTEYLDILRKEVDEFRVLFAEWIKTFDSLNYAIDRWGLFNPPGVNYDDVDPNDDIPFNFNDFDGFEDI